MSDVNVFTGKLDYTGESQASADSNFVNVSGDTMTGELIMGTNPIRLRDSNGVYWEVTLATGGYLKTTQVP